MGVSKNWGTPKWMIYNGNPLKMDDLGVPPFSETPIYIYIERERERDLDSTIKFS